MIVTIETILIKIKYFVENLIRYSCDIKCRIVFFIIVIFYIDLEYKAKKNKFLSILKLFISNQNKVITRR